MSVLTDEEAMEGEVEAYYGTHVTSLQVDHKGRIFATSRRKQDGRDGEYTIVIVNEAADAKRVLPKVIELCQRALRCAV